MEKLAVEPAPLLVRRRHISSVTGLSPSTIRRLEQQGNFPRRRRIGDGAVVGWLYEELQAWLRNQPVA